LILTLDTTCADRLGAYGFVGAGTPNIDRKRLTSRRRGSAHEELTTMKTRIYLAGTLGCLAITMGWVAGCGTKSSPTSPTVGPPTVTALTIKGNAALTAPGQTSQLTLEATLSDGSKKDVTSTALWSSSNKNVVTVSAAGLVTAVGFGQATIQGSVAGNGYPTLVMTVLPAGTYILSGSVTEGGNLPVADVRVETIGGPMSGHAVMTDASGSYAFNGVSGVGQIRATKNGYQPATQTVTQDTEHVNVVLTPTVPYASLGGVYSLTFTVSPSCNLPDDAMKRTYMATIAQTDASLIIVLSGAQFLSSGQLTWNRFRGRVLGNAVSFTLYATYYGLTYGGGVVEEQLANNRYLEFSGTAEAIVTDAGMSAVFAGAVSVNTGDGNGSKPIAVCTASDHRLIFIRPATTTSRKRF
jgi:hypothetical protein